MKKTMLRAAMALAASFVLVGASADAFDDATAARKVGDYVRAAQLYQVAAAQGDVLAQFNLGLMYDQGEGVIQNHAEAVRWYRKAAEQGDAQAHYNLGAIYAKGEGVQQDLVVAHMRFNLAWSLGSERARTASASVARFMTPLQIAQAQQMAARCQERNYKGC